MALTAGSIAFTGFDADVSDHLAFVAIDEIAAGTVIYFNDNEFNGSAFSTGEGVITFTASATIAAGTVVRLGNLQAGAVTAEFGTVTRTGSFDIAGGSDTVYAYIGSAATSPTTFLAAIVNGTFSTTAGALTGTGLTAGQTALELGATVDVAAFDGARSGGSDFRSYLTALNTASNFLTQDGAGDQSVDGTPPDTPFSNTAFTITGGGGTPPVTVSMADADVIESDAGTVDLVFTVTRSNSSGALSLNYATADGTAVSPADYAASAGTVSFADGASTAQITIQVQGDTVDEADEAFTLTLSGAPAGVSITDGSATGTIRDNDAPPSTPLKISEVQGTSFFSPFLAAGGVNAFNTPSSAAVTVQAVVTAIDNAGGRQGFYLMEETADWDTDFRTSEGIFVMTRNDAGVGVPVTDPAFAGLTVGETVTVTAFVVEYQTFDNLPRTFLTNPTLVAQSNTTAALPTYVLDGSDGRRIPNSILSDDNPDFRDSSDEAGDTFDPENDALDYLETIEGMRVTVPDMVVASGDIDGANAAVRFKAYSSVHADAEQINSRGGYTVDGDPPLSPPDTPEADDAVIRGGRHLHDGDVNPDVLELDFSVPGRGGTTGFHNQLDMGDRLGDVTGVFDFDFTQPKLFVTDEIDATRLAGSPAQETTTLTADARSLRMATFNVENLDPGDDATVDETAPGGVGRFNDIARAIAGPLAAPDIIALEEIQDNNGQASGDADASVTLQRLADAVSAETGMRYQWVDQPPANNSEGGAPNGNIRVAFLYNTTRVQLGDLAPDAPIEERRAFTDRIGDGVRDAGDRIAFSDDQLGGEINTADWTNTRRSLLGEFNFNGNTVYAVANHWPSKGGSGDFYQLNQNIDAGEPENRDWEQRNAIAQDVWSMMNLISAGATSARIVAAGDFNEFHFYRPLEVLTGFVDPSGAARADGARFTNLTVSELPEAERYTFVFDGRSQALDHIVVGQDLAAVADYDIVHINTGFSERTGATNPALSDHDPVVARFDFRSFAERLSGGASDDALQGAGGDDTLSGGDGADGLSGDEGDDSLFGNMGADTLQGGDGQDGLFGGQGDDTIFGQAGQDVATGGLGDDLLFGNAGSDFLVGNDGADGLYGGQDDDQLFGDAGADVAAGGLGADLLFGNAGDDFLVGNAGDDGLYGGQDADQLLGEDGSDDLAGGAGDDMITGGAGNDYMQGNAGDDRFAFQAGFGRDVVVDFTAGGTEDEIVFSRDLFDSFDAVRAAARQQGDDVVITSGENVLTLTGVQLAALSADDFLFG